MTETLNIVCSNCRSRYMLTPSEADSLPGSVMVCRTCGHNIKIIVCPQCNACYSLSFVTVAGRHFIMNCKKCTFPVRVSFRPEDEVPGIAVAPHSHNMKTNDYVRREDAGAAGVNDEVVMNGVAPTQEARVSRDSGKEEDVDTRPSPLFSVLKATFSIPVLMTAFVPVLFVVAGLMFFRGSPSFFAGRGFAGFFMNMMLFLFFSLVHVITAAVIAEMSLRPGKGGPAAAAAGMFLKAAGKAGPALAVSLVLYAILHGMLALFNSMPVVRPLLFALLFFPLYAFFVLALGFLSVGFWFYPPYLANSAEKEKGTFVNFMRVHFLKILYLLPLMILVCLPVLALASALQGFAFSLVSSLVIPGVVISALLFSILYSFAVNLAAETTHIMVEGRRIRTGRLVREMLLVTTLSVVLFLAVKLLG